MTNWIEKLIFLLSANTLTGKLLTALVGNVQIMSGYTANLHYKPGTPAGKPIIKEIDMFQVIGFVLMILAIGIALGVFVDYPKKERTK